MKKMLRNFFVGIAYGCTISCFIMLGGALIWGDKFVDFTAKEFIIQIVCSMITGIGFVCPTVVYEKDNLSHGMQVLIQMSIGVPIYVICAIIAKWIPVDGGVGIIISSILIMLVASILIWTGFYVYYRREAMKINKKIGGIDK